MRARTLVLVVFCGCTGQIAAPSSTSGTPGQPTDPTKPGEPTPDQCAQPQSMRVPTQRLSRWQYERLVRETFGASLQLPQAFPLTQTKAAPYSTWPEANDTGETAVKGIADAAEGLADQLTDGLPACTGMPEAMCARSELSGFASRGFRRAATAEELDLLTGLFTSMRTDFTYRESLALSVAALLQMPQTLYALEARSGALSRDELAQRLALVYLGGLPDETLAAAPLLTAAERGAEARRLMAAPRGHEAMTRFVFEWLMLEGFVADQYPAVVQRSLEGELQRFIAHALQQPNGFQTLLTSSTGFVDATLETFYGLPVMPKDASGWREVTLTGRVGLLTHPLLMARTAHGLEPSLILRGKFVRTLLLCGELANPPAGATAMQPDAGGDTSPRGASIARSQISQCNGCHQLMDPIGFTFLGIDGAGKPMAGSVDVSGEIIAGGEVTGRLSGVAELGQKLAGSDEVARCFTRQWLRYGMGHKETAADACTVKQLSDRFVSSGRRLDALFAGLAELDAFAQRTDGATP